jgi:hypothetical protein
LRTGVFKDHPNGVCMYLWLSLTSARHRPQQQRLNTRMDGSCLMDATGQIFSGFIGGQPAMEAPTPNYSHSTTPLQLSSLSNAPKFLFRFDRPPPCVSLYAPHRQSETGQSPHPPYSSRLAAASYKHCCTCLSNAIGDTFEIVLYPVIVHRFALGCRCRAAFLLFVSGGRSSRRAENEMRARVK